ncbi:MAG: galactokinase [Verrucomicrobiota bacterium]
MLSAERFTTTFGHPPTIAATAPGRINLIGEHIDYLDGYVLPAAIEPHLSFAAKPRSNDTTIRVSASILSETIAEVDLRDLTPRTDPSLSWQNYIVGVVAEYDELGHKATGFDLTIDSTLPVGAGLSSSAALETGIALIVEATHGIELGIVERALLCQRAEHKFAGVPCGIMDQLAVGGGLAGHAILIDCAERSYRPIPIPEDLSLVVADTGVKHALADGEYGKRRRECESALEQLGKASWRSVAVADLLTSDLKGTARKRADHAVSEIERVRLFTEALESREVAALGSLMRASHESLRYDYEVSCEELDALVDFAYQSSPPGFVGTRMTGGGFGGSTVSLVESVHADNYIKTLTDFYQQKFNRNLNAFTTRPENGASITTLQ